MYVVENIQYVVNYCTQLGFQSQYATGISCLGGLITPPHLLETNIPIIE